MIDFIKGQVVHKEVDYIVIEANAIGYRVFVANPLAYNDVEANTVVFIHYHVREDAILLYGFGSRAEQALFRRLIEVSGIGPRVAIGILSRSHPDDLVAAIRHENLAALTKLPGVGNKTAQRIILDLKDKLHDFTWPANGSSSAIGDNTADATAIRATSSVKVWDEARDGLLSLGYTDAELERTWQQIKSQIQPEDTIDLVMKLALKILYQAGRTR